LLTLGCFVFGVILYTKGFTYEGMAFFVMVSGTIFCFPYYQKIFTWVMTAFVFTALLPAAIWLQNKGIEGGMWYYPPDHPYFFGLITKTGQGWKNWSQILWLGNDMPVMEYIFYPLFCFFNVVLYCFFTHLVPDKWEKYSPHFSKFYWFLLVLVGAYFALPFFFDPHGIDYDYGLIAVGSVISLFTFFKNKAFRRWLASPAGFFYVLLVGAIFYPAWEFIHSLVNHDWIYEMDNLYTPAAYCYNDACISYYEILAYLTIPFVFQAIFYNAIRIFGKIVIRDPKNFPFAVIDEKGKWL